MDRMAKVTEIRRKSNQAASKLLEKMAHNQRPPSRPNSRILDKIMSKQGLFFGSRRQVDFPIEFFLRPHEHLPSGAAVQQRALDA